MRAPLKRYAHETRARGTGRYLASPRCDGCGKPVGTAYYTDDEVCGGSDGPGFYVCERKRCAAKLTGLSVEARRAIYVATRAAHG